MVQGTSGTASGLVFRYQNDDNFYRFNVTGNGLYNLELMSRGTLTVLIDWTPSHAIRQIDTRQSTFMAARQPPAPVWNGLRVALHGKEMTLFVNGAALETTVDGTFSRGAVALSVNTFGSGAAVCFDNLFVGRNN
ncbi:MAG: hypothetical protein HC893_15385 [Chloroflexaceae bacterium]|nr:hypothetical protein [Chloroflexaceae bacterium]